MIKDLTDVAFNLGWSAPKGSRNPYKSGTDLATEWARGRDQARRIAKMDLRPAFRRSGKRFERYTPAHCK